MLHPECDRAHQWISLDLDGELSAFEGTLLQAHLAECEDCVAFRSDVVVLTAELREAQLQPLERRVDIAARRRRRFTARLAPAVAALAIAAVGLGSVLASLNLGQGFNPAGDERSRAGESRLFAVNQLRISQLQSASQLRRERIGPLSERRLGGPVVPGTPIRP
jgi:predicted anti-sigma-YlaC factor YlaD